MRTSSFALPWALALLVLGSSPARGDGPVIGWGVGNAPPTPLDELHGSASALFPGGRCAVQSATGTVYCSDHPYPIAISAVAFGRSHHCWIEAGTNAVGCSGRNYAGQAMPPDSVNGEAGTASAIVVGEEHSCAIRAENGVVVCWGSRGSGRIGVPLALNGTLGTASAITAGAAHNCAIQSATGAVVCWGANGASQASPPPSVNGTLGSATAIATGEDHNCAIRAGTGEVVCWGRNYTGEASPPASLNGVEGSATAIAAGFMHTCAIQAATRAAICWGDDYNEQLTPPTGPGGATLAVEALSAGAYHTLAIRAPLPQTITFEPLSDRIYGDPPFEISAVSTSTLPVTFSAVGSCSVDGIRVSIVHGGRCTVTASQPGNFSFAPAPDVSREFAVTYSFRGFVAPVANPPAFNRVTAGSAVAIRFELAAHPDSDVIADGYPMVQRVDCHTYAPLDAAEPARHEHPRWYVPGQKWVPRTYVWKTEKSWAGSCRRFVLGLDDGTEHWANFRFEQ